MSKSARIVQTPGAEPEADDIAQLEAAQAAADRAAMSEKLTSNRPEAGLRAADVDPTKIKRAVLTLDGWVCPDVSPAFQQAA